MGPDATDRRVTAGFGASVEDQLIKQLDQGDETATAVLKDGASAAERSLA